jgi:hypothetical protein
LSFFLAVLVVDVGDPVSYIVFEGDYDALSAANLLEITRAIIYNYLLSIWLSIISYPTIYKGTIDFHYSKIDINTFVFLF